MVFYVYFLLLNIKQKNSFQLNIYLPKSNSGVRFCKFNVLYLLFQVVPNLNHNKNPLHETFKIHKRKLKESHNGEFQNIKHQKISSAGETNGNVHFDLENNKNIGKPYDEKKNKSDEKRLESIKRKRLEFNEKKRIIKTGLTSIVSYSNSQYAKEDIKDVIYILTYLFITE